MNFTTVAPTTPILRIELTQDEVNELYRALKVITWTARDSQFLAEFYLRLTHHYRAIPDTT